MCAYRLQKKQISKNPRGTIEDSILLSKQN